MLFASNFLGVFNDNFLKNSIIFIAIAWTLPSWLSHSQLISIVAAGLVLPYLIFSPIGGMLAVKHSKLKVFRIMKLIELPIMLIAVLAFYKEWIYLAIFSIFLMGIQSSLYSPSKYSLIRDIGGKQGVSFGSGMFETMAFMGILLGTFFASLLSDNYSISYFSWTIVLVAILGYWVTSLIRTKEQAEITNFSATLNPFSFVKNNYLIAKAFKGVNSAVIGSSSFWLLSNMLQMNVIIHSKSVYHVSNTTIGFIMALAAIGIALGTGMTGYLSGSRVQIKLITPTLSAMSLFLLLMLMPIPFWLFVTLAVLFALMAGIFQVPNMALIQLSELGRKRGNIVAYLNMMNFLFILIGTALFSITNALSNDNSRIVFGVMLVLNLLVLLYFQLNKKRMG